MPDQFGREMRRQKHICFKLYLTPAEQNGDLMGILSVRGNKSHVEFLS